MPYANHERQKAYQRIYMKRKRTINNLAKLMARREWIIKQYDTDPIMKRFDPEREHVTRLDAKIQIQYNAVQQLTGLLQNQLNCQKIGEGGKPVEMSLECPSTNR